MSLASLGIKNLTAQSPSAVGFATASRILALLQPKASGELWKERLVAATEAASRILRRRLLQLQSGARLAHFKFVRQRCPTLDGRGTKLIYEGQVSFQRRQILVHVSFGRDLYSKSKLLSVEIRIISAHPLSPRLPLNIWSTEVGSSSLSLNRNLDEPP